LGEIPFSELCTRYQLEEFLGSLQEKKNRYGQPLSGKRIQNVMIPLRVIASKAIDRSIWMARAQEAFLGTSVTRNH
jgi:hypothetical protein